jgi:large subunit ribosomal protein L14e
MGIRAGEIVKSRAGRDAGRYFVVKEIIDDSYVLIVDGSLRKLEKPKKKKVKHLEPTGDIIDGLIRGFRDEGGRITNKEINRAIKDYLKDKGIGIWEC